MKTGESNKEAVLGQEAVLVEEPVLGKETAHVPAELPDILWKIITALWGARSAWHVPSATIAPSAYPFANNLIEMRRLADSMKASPFGHSAKHTEQSGPAGS